MTTFRTKQAKEFTTISNDAVRDGRLSLKARGLHHVLLSYPDNRQFNLADLINESDKDGRDSIRAAIAELETLGYVNRTRERDRSGQLKGMAYEVVNCVNETEGLAVGEDSNAHTL